MINCDLFSWHRTIGGYVKDRKWIEEAEHLKTMIKNNCPDVKVRFSSSLSFANVEQQFVQLL